MKNLDLTNTPVGSNRFMVLSLVRCRGSKLREDLDAFIYRTTPRAAAGIINEALVVMRQNSFVELVQHEPGEIVHDGVRLNTVEWLQSLGLELEMGSTLSSKLIEALSRFAAGEELKPFEWQETDVALDQWRPPTTLEFERLYHAASEIDGSSAVRQVTFEIAVDSMRSVLATLVDLVNEYEGTIDEAAAEL